MGQLESKERIEIAGLLQAILGDNRRRIVFPIVEDSSGSVSIVRQRIGRERVTLL
jgi:hypothetical protein